MRGGIPSFPSRLKELRASRDMSQVRLAEVSGTHPDTIVKMEKGQRLPTLELAWRIATALGVSVNDLLPSRYHPEVAVPGGRAKPAGPTSGA